MRPIKTIKTSIRNRARAVAIASALILTLAGSAQPTFAAAPNGPVAPPPGKTAAKAKTCVVKGKIGVKTAKGCIVKLGPVAPPPGM